MKSKTFWLLAALWLVAAFWIFPNIGGQNTGDVVTPPAELFQQVQQLETEAGDDEGKLKDVVKKYQDVANAKKYRGTEYEEEAKGYAADALLRVAIIQETKFEDERGAINTYRRLAKISPDVSESVVEGEERLEAFQQSIDERHKDELGYKFIDFLVGLTGHNPNFSYAIALLIITLIFKVITTPLSKAQFKSMKEMQKIQPLVKQLQEKYRNNQQELGKKTMELYKEHGVNPFSSCLPLLLQMPFLILLYWKVIMPYQYQFTNGKLLWIGSSLADKFPTIVASNLAMPDLPLLLTYTVSMIISQKISIVDPSQAQQQKIMAYTMPIIFAFIFYSFPSAFMLYWLFFNVISTIQQYHIMHGPSSGNTPPGGNGNNNGEKKIDPVAEAITEVKSSPKPSKTAPGKKSKRRKKRFDRKIMYPVPAAC